MSQAAAWEEGYRAGIIDGESGTYPYDTRVNPYQGQDETAAPPLERPLPEPHIKEEPHA